MERCDVLVVGGGPAGSTTARRLVEAGCDVVVIDKAVFPRDKPCTGWITPAVVGALGLDLAAYARGQTLQAFTGFRTGPIAGPALVTEFHRTVSYGIRRSEFDHYLLGRSGARLLLGHALTDLRREGREWIVNDTIRTPVVVGAGGHFCPVARRSSPDADRGGAIIAREMECAFTSPEADGCLVSPEWPELYFWPDLLGYGWCVRKGDYLNVGAGHFQEPDFPARVREFVGTLAARGIVLDEKTTHWKGHAYFLNRTSPRRVYEDGLLLVGDAAGLALAPSGEGILAAVESGLMAAETILDAAPDFGKRRLSQYGEQIDARFGPRGDGQGFGRLPSWLTAIASRTLLKSPSLTRRLLLEHAFLHQRRPAFDRKRARSVEGPPPVR